MSVRDQVKDQASLCLWPRQVLQQKAVEEAHYSFDWSGKTFVKASILASATNANLMFSFAFAEMQR